jgi:nucleosome binding factor SPN SPT16 subunit
LIIWRFLLNLAFVNQKQLNNLQFCIDYPPKDDSLVVASGTPRYSGYCSRIGRTWPISGKFTQEQAEIYDVVLFVHKGIINILKNKPTSLDECYVFMVLSLAQKLLELGFFQNTDKDKVLQEVRLLRKSSKSIIFL